MIKQFKSSLGLVILLSSLSIADTPSAPGPYIGVSKIGNSIDSVRLSFKDNSNNEIYNMIGLYETNSVPSTPTPADTFLRVKAVPATSGNQVYIDIDKLECNKVYTAVAFSYNDEGYSAASTLRSFNLHSTLGVSCSPIKVDAGSDKTVSLASGKVTLHANIIKNIYPDDLITTWWTIESKPDGSSASMDDDYGLTASFLPDVAGVYKLKAHIMNVDHMNTDSDTVTVIVIP